MLNPLSPERAQEIGRCLQRYSEIGTSTIINPRDEAEKLGLEKFFTQVMVEHGSEFMGCWMAIRTEYEPLVQVLARIGQRITSVNRPPAAPVASAPVAVAS